MSTREPYYYIMEPETAYAALPAREDLHVEFKDARSGLPENLCDTLCAFLNTDGGMLYDLMMGFVEKHLNDPFYLENGATISLRERIFREAISNIISHREYRDATPARLMIYKDRVVLDNPAMAYFHTRITPQNLRSHPKNPSICKFMIQIGRFDQLGSGVLNIHKYWPVYAPGTDPVFRETRHGFELNLALGESAKMAVPTKSGLESAPATPQVTQQVTQQVAPQVTQQVEKLLSVCSGAMSRAELQAKLALKDRMSFVEQYLQPSIEKGFIELTIPEKPNSRLQKYRLSPKGRLAAGKGKERV